MRNKFLIFTAFVFFINNPVNFGQSADEIINKYITAIGGLEKMKSVKTEKTVISIESGGMTIEQTIYKKRPNMLREETTLQGKTSLQVFNGTEGWVVNPFTGRETVEAMPEDDIKEMKIQADMDGELIDYAKKGFKVSAEGEEDVEGAMAYKLKLVTDKNDVINFFIDKETSYLVKQSFKQKNEDGSEAESELVFSNFKPVEGKLMAFEMQANSKYMGQVYKTPIKVVSVEFNKEISDDLFKKPEIKK
jgi:outer membrane lipoprotein-sorting protein